MSVFEKDRFKTALRYGTLEEIREAAEELVESARVWNREEEVARFVAEELEGDYRTVREIDGLRLDGVKVKRGFDGLKVEVEREDC